MHVPHNIMSVRVKYYSFHHGNVEIDLFLRTPKIGKRLKGTIMIVMPERKVTEVQYTRRYRYSGLSSAPSWDRSPTGHPVQSNSGLPRLNGAKFFPTSLKEPCQTIGNTTYSHFEAICLCRNHTQQIYQSAGDADIGGNDRWQMEQYLLVRTNIYPGMVQCSYGLWR